MSGRAPVRAIWGILLWLALLAGIVVAWSPRYWAVSVALGALSLVVAAWALSFAGSSLDWPRQTPLVLLIGVWGFLQVLLGTSAIPGLTMGNSIVWLVSACAFIAGAQILRHRNAGQAFLKALLWSVTGLAVAAMIQSHTPPVQVFGIFPADPSVMGTFLSENQFAALMEIAAPVALWYMLGRNPVPGGLCFVMLLAGTITSGSRMGVILVCSEAVAFVAIVLVTRRMETKKALGIFAGLVVLIAAATGIAGFDAIRSHFEEKNPYAIRKQLLDSTVRLVRESPWKGYGMGTWRAEYPHTASFDLALLANEAHNDWAQWASDGGIPFVTLMLALVVWLARPAVESIWGLGILCVMVHSYVDYPIREPVLSLVWFTLAGGAAGFATQISERSRRVGRGPG